MEILLMGIVFLTGVLSALAIGLTVGGGSGKHA